MATLTEYHLWVDQLTHGAYPAAMQQAGYSLAETAAFLAQEIQEIAWSPVYQGIARELVHHCNEITRQQRP